MGNWKLVLGILGGTLLLLLGVSIVFSSRMSSTTAVDENVLVGDSRHARGADAARVTVVEFSDFECPACRQAQPMVDSLLEQYADRVRLVYRHFPLTSIHPLALPAAIASEAAGAQGKFWEFGHVLFDQQDAWSKVKDPTELFVSYAKDVEVPDIDAFRDQLSRQTGRPEVLADLGLGNKVGVGGTPTFFVNGQLVTIDGLRLAVEKVLSKPK